MLVSKNDSGVQMYLVFKCVGPRARLIVILDMVVRDSLSLLDVFD